jgi:lipopolysaccharide transport protein LptA
MLNRAKDTGMRAARWLRPAVKIVLGLVLLVIAGYLAYRIAVKPRLRLEAIKVPQDKVDVKEGIRGAQLKGSKGRIEFRGDRSLPLDEKRYKLEGHVEIIDRGRTGGREIRTSAGSVIYDKDWTRFTAEGGVRVTFKNTTLEAATFDYDRVHEVMTTSSGGTFASARLEGSAAKITFYPKDEIAVLEEDLSFRLKTRISPDVPVMITGDKFVYNVAKRSGDVEGRIVLVHGKSRGTGRRAHVEQFEKTDDVRILELGGEARLALEGEIHPAPKAPAGSQSGGPAPPASVLGQNLSLDESVRQEISSETIRLQASRPPSFMERAEFSGGADVKFFFSSGAVTEIRGAAVAAAFGKTGLLTDLRVTGEGRISSRGADGGAARTIEGWDIVIDNVSRVVSAASGESTRARFVSATSDVSGGKITIAIDTEDFEAEGSVRMSFQAGTAETAKNGFFSPDRPVFAWARSMRFSSRDRRFSLWDPADRVRCSQDNRVVSAKEIVISEDGRELAGTGGVQVAFPHKPKEGEPERRIEISAARMRLDPESNQVIYEDGCVLKTGTTVLTCGRIIVEPGEGGEEVRAIHALKGNAATVTITMDARIATGTTGFYDVRQDTITLTGQPVLREKDKGEIRGDKLTFNLSDGRIRVQDRSMTTIKS